MHFTKFTIFDLVARDSKPRRKNGPRYKMVENHSGPTAGLRRLLGSESTDLFPS